MDQRHLESHREQEENSTEEAESAATRRAFIKMAVMATGGAALAMTSCSSQDGGSKSAEDEGDGSDLDTDVDTDSDSDTDSDADLDSDSDTDSDTDTDSDSDTDVDADSDSDSDSDADSDAGAGNESDTASVTDNEDDSGADTEEESGKSKVFIVAASERVTGLEELLALTDLGFASGKKIVIKPNFNSSNAFPASTHDDTIRTVVGALKDAGCGDIVLGESSGYNTQTVIAEKGTLALCDSLGISFMNFDSASTERESFSFPGMGWGGQLAIPKIMRSDHAVVLLPCCKTHGVGGHFTMSLKLAVGLIPRNRRRTMHASNQIRSWIADINKGYEPDLVVMDALRCFISGGPDSGTARSPGLLLASKDRVAIDAVGVAVLKRAGSNVGNNRRVFQQDQIRRAVELGLGATSPDEIELVGNDDTVISELREILDNS